MKKDDLNKKQRYALDTMLSGSNVFLTGDAGTGKTTVIQTFIDEAEKAGKNVLYPPLLELQRIISDMGQLPYTGH